MKDAAGIKRTPDTEREFYLGELRRKLTGVRDALKRLRNKLFIMSCDLQKQPETLPLVGRRVLVLANEIRQLEQTEAMLEQSIQQLE